MLNDERGSLRSRSAAAVSSLTLRQISAVLPPEQAWGLWLSRQIVARIMDAFGPLLAGTHVVAVDTRTSDGRRVVGEWVYGAGVPRDQVHVFQALPRLSPEARPAMGYLASFIAQELRDIRIDQAAG